MQSKNTTQNEETRPHFVVLAHFNTMLENKTFTEVLLLANKPHNMSLTDFKP
jgi:hypothetical protein